MPDQHGTIHLTGEIRQRLERGVGVGYAAKTDVGHTLLREFVQGSDRELSVRVRSTRLRADAEVRPDDLVTESDPAREAAPRRRARSHVVEHRLVETRSPAPDLVRHVDGMALAHEVLVPPHSTVRRGLPRLARQGRAMNHHHGYVAIAALRHHVAHVHLVDGDVPARAEVAQLTLGLFNLLAADEEAALRLQHQGRVGSLNIFERLRHHGAGRAGNARQANTGHDRRSNQHHESLTSHSQSPYWPRAPLATHTANSLRHLQGSSGNQRTGPCEASLAYSSTNPDAITHWIVGFGKRPVHVACRMR